VTNTFLTDIRENIRQSLKIILWTSAAVFIGSGIPFLVVYKGGMFPQIADHLDKLHIEFSLLICLQPIIMLGVAAISMIIEIFGIGYKHSTLKRLITVQSNSLLNDLFYFLMRVSGLIPLIVLAISLGNFYVIKEYLSNILAFNLLFSIPVYLHIIPIVLFHSFAFYFYHRLMHTKMFWEIHKVHHSAEDFNILLPYRNHPIDFLFAKIIIPSFTVMLGANTTVVLIYLLLNSVYQSMVHSEFAWNKSWINEILITPEAHKIHHATEAKYFDKNFGILTIWDRLFGTYCPPTEKIEKIGVNERDDFNTGHPVGEMVNVFLRWLKFKK